MNLHQLLKASTEHDAAALHLTTGAPPALKLADGWTFLKTPPLTPLETKQLIYSVLTESQVATLESNGLLQISFGVKDLARFVMTVYSQRGAYAAELTSFPFRLPESPAWLSSTLAWLDDGAGLVIAAGARKPASMALAAWVNQINETRAARIVTIEQPITVLHPHKHSIVDQVEIGGDCSVAAAQTLVQSSGASVFAIDLVDGFDTVVAALRMGALVLASLRAPTVEAASAWRVKLPPHLEPLVRGVVFLDTNGAATVL